VSFDAPRPVVARTRSIRCRMAAPIVAKLAIPIAIVFVGETGRQDGSNTKSLRRSRAT
jgi:hypothetical protein